MRRQSIKKDCCRTSDELIRIALRGWNGARSWRAIAELQMRGSPGTLALAQSLFKSGNCRRRALGLLIASQLRQRVRGIRFGNAEYSLAQTQQLLLYGLHDDHPEVLQAAASGLGHRPHPAALGRLVQLASHPEALVRFDVAFALGNYEAPEAVEALLTLAGDRDVKVRDWATFALGSLHGADTPEIRERLWRNLCDPDRDVRGEAVVGLAKRGDARAVDHLLVHLNDDCGMLDLSAAEKLGATCLLPLLLRLWRDAAGETDVDPGWLNQLRDAIAACSAEAASP